MLIALFRSPFINGWTATLAVIVAVSMTMSASLLTMAFLLVLGAAPWVLMLLLPRTASSPSVAEILYAAKTN